MGLNITLQTKTKTCLISNVHPSSAAVGYGVRVNDEILPPSSITGDDPGTYDFFLEAVKHRPIRFEVKRPITAEGTKVIAQTLYTLHRFVITQAGSIGMSLGRKGNSTYVSSVLLNSLSDIYGIFKDDIVCKPFTNGAETEHIFSWICDYYANHPHRPLVVEVWRPVSRAEGTRTSSQLSCSANKNPFTFAFPPTVASQNSYGRDEVLHNHDMEAAESTTGKEHPPIILLVDDSDNESEDSTGEEKKKE